MSVSPEDTFDGDDENFNADLRTVPDNIIPEGEYPVICTDVKKSVSKAGNPMFVWSFSFKGNDKARPMKFVSHTVLSEQALFKVAQFTEALGLGKKGEKVQFSRKQAIGRQCFAVVVTEEFNGEKSSKIKSLKPHPQGAVPKTEDIPF